MSTLSPVPSADVERGLGAFAAGPLTAVRGAENYEPLSALLLSAPGSYGPVVGGISFAGSAVFFATSGSATVISPFSSFFESGFAVPRVRSISAALTRSRVLFELKVIAAFLREVVAHPLTTSRLVVDSEKRSIEVERD
jgi:hypothetical protein